nr:ABC transporter A family member 9-like [Tanacetum cinerariifolium]
MVDFVPGRAVIDATQCKRDKYMYKCAAIGYGFLPFSFSSLGELEADAPCSTCSKVFAGDIYVDHAVSCAGIIGIKHRHNVVGDTLVDICYRSGISGGKEFNIGLDEGRDKPLRPTDMLLYSWDGGLDVCVDLTGSSPLTQTWMADFVHGRAVIDAAHHKRVKYETKCVAIVDKSFSLLHYLLWGN